MTRTHTYRGIAWIDLQSPTDDEISGLVKRYALHPLVGEELKRSSSVAKIDFYKDYILAVLTLPVRTREKDGSYAISDRQVDFVIGKNFLITSRTDTVEQLEYFAKVFEANSILNKDEKIEHAGHLFYYMVKRIYAGMCDDLENIRDSLLKAESRIFTGDERQMVQVLSALNRELIDFKQIARVHRDVWERMISEHDPELFGGDFAAYMSDIRDQFNIIHELVSNSRELLIDLRETNDSLLNAKQNEIMKVLTLVAFVFYPLSLIAEVFTIPSTHVPVLGSAYDWITIVSIMLIVAIGMLWFFRRKKWF